MINQDDIKKIAHLARINVSDEESELIEQRLTGIMNLIDAMQKVDTDGVEPMSHALEISQPLRTDEVNETDLRKKTLALAPETEESLFIVPQVIE